MSIRKLLPALLFGLSLVLGLSLGMIAPVDAQAADSPRALARKPSAKLEGVWHSADGKTVTFQSNGVMIYKGRRHMYAAGNGMIQIRNRHAAFRQLPYKIFEGKLTITEGGVETVYTRD